MESEKVKKIKKALECMSGLCKDSLSSICFECEIDKKYDEESACKEALTLINEFERENEILAEEKELFKNQFNELEEYIKANEQDAKAFVNGWHKDLETELKQFAERLKEGLYNFRIWEVPYEEWCKGNVVCGIIDETLKEFVK